MFEAHTIQPMTPPTASDKNKTPVLQYVLLGIIVLASSAYYLGGMTRVLHELQHGETALRLPFDFNTEMRTITSIEPEASKAGARLGDQVLSLNGRPYTGYAQLLNLMGRSHAGESLTAEILHASGATSKIEIPLQTLHTGPASVPIWVGTIALRGVFPLLCLMVGFWVVAAKPQDWNAWLLLGIMASFEFLLPQPVSTGPLLGPALFWSLLVQMCLPLWMMLFGIYFPDRWPLDARFPWAKWIILIPSFLFFAGLCWFTYTKFFNFDAGTHYLPIFALLDRSETVLQVLAISIYFFAAVYKAVTATDRDTRRRLTILNTGTFIGLTPAFFLVMYSLFRERDFGVGVPQWLVVFAVICQTAFPFSLAYIVIVQRAMDVRILLRQGTKYAFARSTLWILQVVFIAAITYRLAQVLHEPRVSRNEIFVLLVLGFIFLAMRDRVARSVSTWLDRKFFREAYSAEQVLSELAEQVRTFTETRPLLETVTLQIGRTLHIEQIAVLLNQGGSYQLQQAVGLTPSGTVMLPENSSAIRHLLHSRAPTMLYGKDPQGWLMLASESEREALQQLSAELLLPLPGRKEMVGVMALGPKLSEEPYSRADLQLLQSVAVQTGLAIENTELMARLGKEAAQRERLSREIEIAREVQERLFPQVMPEIPDGSCAGHCRPALGVGGDYYDFIPLFSGRVGIAVGDVSGKGVSAALVMASLRASLRGITLSGSPDIVLDLPTLIQTLSRLIHDASTLSRYATFFFGEYDPHTQLLRYVNAGHNPPVVVRPKPSGQDSCRNDDCEILRLEVGGTVLGLIDNPQYELGSILLRAGDVLVAFTDGISEAMNLREEEWGEEKMIEAICACRTLPADKILECIFSGADAFTQNAPQHDDMTLIVLARTSA